MKSKRVPSFRTALFADPESRVNQQTAEYRDKLGMTDFC